MLVWASSSEARQTNAPATRTCHKRSKEDEHATRQRHCVYYLALLHRRGEELKGRRQLDALAALEADAGNLRAAWQWAIAEHLHAHLARALDGFGLLYEWRGLYQDGEAVYHHAVQAIDGTASAPGLLVLANLLRWQARFNRLLGRSSVAKELAQRSLDLLVSPALAGLDVRASHAATALELGELTADYLEAWSHLESSLALYQSIGDQSGTARACFLLGDLANMTRFDARWQELLEESLQLYQTLGDRRSTISVLKLMGFFAMLRGQHERGESLLRQSLALAHAMPDNTETLKCMYLLGHGITLCGKYAEACAIAEEELLRCQELGNRPMMVHALALSATVHQASGRYTRACDDALLGIQLAEKVDDPRLVSYLSWRLGEIYLAQGRHAEASQLIDNSVEMHRDIRYQARLRDVLTGKGYCAYARGQSQELHLCLVEALQLSIADRAWLTAIRSLPLAALYAVSRGRIETAVELYALASCAQYIANSPWFDDVAGRHVTAAAKFLPAAAVTSAQQR